MTTGTITTLMVILTVLVVLYSIGHLVYQILKKQPIIKIVWRSVINAFAILVCILATILVPNDLSKVVSGVKDGHPEGEQITYGQALDHYLEDVKWEAFSANASTDSNGETTDIPEQMTVEVTGKCPKEDNADIKIQFVFDSRLRAKDITDGSEFTVKYIAINGEPMDAYFICSFFHAAFSSYAAEENVPYNGRFATDTGDDSDSYEYDGLYEDDDSYGNDGLYEDDDF